MMHVDSDGHPALAARPSLPCAANSTGSFQLLPVKGSLDPRLYEHPRAPRSSANPGAGLPTTEKLARKMWHWPKQTESPWNKIKRKQHYGQTRKQQSFARKTPVVPGVSNVHSLLRILVKPLEAVLGQQLSSPPLGWRAAAEAGVKSVKCRWNCGCSSWAGQGGGGSSFQP